jgi:hypothetical protein
MISIVAIAFVVSIAVSIATIAISIATISVSIATIAASVTIVNLSVTVPIKPERKHNVAYNPHNIKWELI